MKREIYDTVEVAPWGKWKVAVVRTFGVEKSLARLNDGDVDGLAISTYDYQGPDLSFLEGISTDRDIGIVLPFAETFDISILERFSRLRFLTLGESTQAIDLSVFQSLEDLRIQWHSGVKLPVDGSQSLTDLQLAGYRPNSQDLTDLPHYPNLAALEIDLSNIKSLNGIERFQALREARFSYLENLTAVQALRQSAVQSAHFHLCRKIADADSLADAKEIRSLRLNDCGELDNLDFIRQMPKLEEFRFVGTNVLNGDLSPCLGLKIVAFDGKRHYSHKPKQFNDGLEQ